SLVTEKDESNLYHMDFRMCWPADLHPGPSLTLINPSGSSTSAPDLQVAYGGEVCITPDYMNSAMTGSGENVYVDLLYSEVNSGELTAEGIPNLNVYGEGGTTNFVYGWINAISWDGIIVRNDTSRPELAPNSSRAVRTTVNLGVPDGESHVLQIFLDSHLANASRPWRQVPRNGDEGEADETNNIANITVRWCEWGAELGVGMNLTIGTQLVPWGGAVCITDEDIIRTNMETYCSEGGCVMTGADEEMIYIAYTEVNTGAQPADAGSGGWTNMFYYDNVSAIVNMNRQELGVNESRQVLAHGINRYGVDAVVFRPYDLEPHKLTFRLDADNQVAWRTQEMDRLWEMDVRFCLEEMLVTYNGKCGCAGDLQGGDTFQFGNQTVAMNQSAGSAVCLTPSDAGADLVFGITYTESNANHLSLLDIGDGYRNQIFWDGVSMGVSNPRPALKVGESRTVEWEGGIQLTPDRETHVLEIVLDSPYAGAELSPEEAAAWEMQPEVSDNNTYRVNVSFCEFKPDLDAGAGMWIGTQWAPWNSTTCLKSDDIKSFTTGTGSLLYGVDVMYTETNIGLDWAMGTYVNEVHYDEVQVITDSGRQTLKNGDSRNISNPWAFDSINKVSIEADAYIHMLEVKLDTGSQSLESNENNRWPPPSPPSPPPSPPPPRCPTCTEEFQSERAGSSTCDCVYVIGVTMRTSNEVETFSNLLFIDGIAESLEVDPYQVVVRDKSAGSTIVIFEVQPPVSLEWFKEEKDVNRMVDTLRGGDVRLHSSFGDHTVLEITIPVNVQYSEDESSDGLSLGLIIGICVGSFAVMAMVVIGVAYYMVREKEGQPGEGSMDSPLMASKVHPLPQSSSSSPPPPLPDGAQVTTSPFMDTSNENGRPESSGAGAVSEGVAARNPDELTPLQSFHEDEANPMNVDDPTATSAFASQDHASSASGSAQLSSAGEGEVKIAPMPLAGGLDLAPRNSRLIPGNNGQPMRAPAFLAPL
ncbi:hypothetical protein CYMTET_3139, partial [Cymbomonas tetramitiformis]